MLKKVNYDKLLENELVGFNEKHGKKPDILLHSCCAPCSSYVIEYLFERSNLTVFYFNPNISPEAEYMKRLDEQKRFIKITGKDIKVIEGDYDNGSFLENIDALKLNNVNEPEGGKRCKKCFEIRLFETAKLAKQLAFDYFTTTLTISPHKNAEIINNVLIKSGVFYDVCPLPADFKKRDGYKRSIELSREYGLYRQNYCGCAFTNN